jgi:hypothetical protein
MIDFKKIFKIILFGIIIGLALYFLLNKTNILNFNKNTKVTQQVATQLYSSNEKLKEVIIFYGDSQSDKLKSFPAKIYETPNVINQIKQILLLLFDKPPKDYIKVIPEGTSIREVYIDSNSIIYIDLSEEFIVNNRGGTTFEYLSVYSILKSIFSNFNNIRGIRLLVNGVEQETIAGHLNISEIFRPQDIN